MKNIMFEKHFSKTILTRGYNYYQSGQIVDLERISDTNWQAEVKGSSLYIVDVTLTPDGKPDDLDCDCPYEYKCKHMAAVLYAIRDELKKPNVTRQTKKMSLKELLQQQTKEQLIDIILSAGKQHRAFLKELELQLMPVEDVVATAEKLIIHHIEQSKDRRSGFIAWGAVEEAMEGIYRTQERAEQCIEEGDYFTAFELALLCFRHAFDAFECTDDSSGDIEYAIEESLALIARSLEEGAETWNPSQYDEVFTLISAEASNPNLDDWPSWHVALLRCCIPLCESEKIQGKFKTLLKSLRKSEGSWRAEYINKELLELEFQLLSFIAEEEEVEKFLEEHLDNPAMRERIIESAMEQGNYEKVVELSMDGLKQDTEKRGIANRWRTFAFTAHKALGNKEEMRKLAHDLICAGEIDYIEELKMLYTAEEWPVKHEELLDELQKTNNYAYSVLIVQEQQVSRILDYCKESPRRVESHYSYIYESYYEDTCALFIDFILADAASSSTRKAYQNVCRSIQTMKQAGYKVEAKNLIEDLLQMYSKRRAFVDELYKIS